MSNITPTCIHKKQHSARNIGKTYISYCGKTATCMDTNGRTLCNKHYNKWFIKTYNRKSITDKS